MTTENLDPMTPSLPSREEAPYKRSPTGEIIEGGYYEPNPIWTAINDLGGNEAFAEAISLVGPPNTHVSKRTVYVWKSTGIIPYRQRPNMNKIIQTYRRKLRDPDGLLASVDGRRYMRKSFFPNRPLQDAVKKLGGIGRVVRLINDPYFKLPYNDPKRQAFDPYTYQRVHQWMKTGMIPESQRIIFHAATRIPFSIMEAPSEKEKLPTRAERPRHGESRVARIARKAYEKAQADLEATKARVEAEDIDALLGDLA